MSKRRKIAKVMLTLEQQLAAMPPRPTWPEIAEPWMGPHVQPLVASQLEWDRRRADLGTAISFVDGTVSRFPPDTGPFGVVRIDATSVTGTGTVTIVGYPTVNN